MGMEYFDPDIDAVQALIARAVLMLTMGLIH